MRKKMHSNVFKASTIHTVSFSDRRCKHDCVYLQENCRVALMAVFVDSNIMVEILLHLSWQITWSITICSFRHKKPLEKTAVHYALDKFIDYRYILMSERNYLMY